MENLSNFGVGPKYMPLHLIEEFTNHFSNDLKIGGGTYGDVYKGTYNGEEVAVKMLRLMPEKDDQKQFMNEVENLMRLRHENIVRLIAYSYEVKYKCVEIFKSPIVPKLEESQSAMVPSKRTMVLAAEIHRALCFEYLQKGSLQNYLKEEYDALLDWPTRYKIIKGTCEALKYLHEELEIPLLHLDLKPDNILLDKNMVPKLADFGLSKPFTEERTQPLQNAEQTKSQFSGGVVGTIGYMPPEYIDKKKVTKKFDVFSLGVIIIKIMTGGQHSYATPPRDVFIEQVYEKWRERLKAAAYSAFDEECCQVKTCIETALDCVDSDPDKRPDIGSIVRSLNETENKIEKFVVSLPHDETINAAGSHAKDMPARKALVQVNPQELCYRYPMEPNKNLASSLQLTNMTDHHVAYMFVASGEVGYSSERAKGIISPRSKWEVVLNVKAHNASGLQQENKVILRSTIVNKDLNPDGITLEMFKRTDRIVDELKLTVIEAPAPSQSPVQDELGKQQSHQKPSEVLGKGHPSIADPFKMLDAQPLELRFHFERNKLVPCSVELTNTKDKHIAFRLIEKTGDSSCFVELPRQGILPPWSCHTLIVTTKKLEEQPLKRDYDLILQSCLLEYFHLRYPPFEDQYECEKFFNRVKESGGLVHEIAMKASQEKPSEILSMEPTRDIFYCLDTNPIKKWIITGYCSGYIRIGNYETQMAVNSLKLSNTAVCVVKFIAQKKCFVAGSFDGFLHVYDYGTKPPNKKRSWKACGGFITSLAIHPTEPYVLSSAYGDPIKLWNMEDGWECTQTFKDHTGLVRQLVFNPADTNVFASASNDKTIKVWKLSSPFPEYTLDGHAQKVTCLDYFSCGNHQYLISGSNDQTAKIWDIQKKLCVKTIDGFSSPLTCVNAHPNLLVIITGSEDGFIHLWSSTDFRLERVLNITSGGDVRGIGCLMGSRRVMIGQSGAISELSIGTMNYHEAYMPCSEQHLSGDEAQEETASEESYIPSGDLLQVHPLQLHFPVGVNKLTPCPVHLTNNTNERVAFMLKHWDWHAISFLNLPLRGIVPPRSTYTLIVTAQKLNKPPKWRDINLILKSRAVTENNIGHPIFTLNGDKGTEVNEVTMKAVYITHGEISSEVTPHAVKVLSVERITELYSFDTNELKQWIIIGDADGYVRIRNYHTQKPVNSVRVSMEQVCCTKIIPRKQWFLAASWDGFICVYNFETKRLVIRFKASDGYIRSMAVHSTEPYVLSAADSDTIKLWNWEKCREGRWECTQTFEGHTSAVNQITFNPLDSNTFASASNDGTIKVWNLTSPYPDDTFSGHSDQVHCVDYFTRGDQLFLISGAHDHKAKIWDQKEKKCVKTLEAFSSPVTSVCSFPKLSVIITGSRDGSVALWSSTDFRLQRILNIGGCGDVKGFGCLVGSRRILIGQSKAVSLLTMDNMDFEEAALVAVSEPEISANLSPGDRTPGEKKSAASELLDIAPLQFHFLSGVDKFVLCSLKLTNKIDERVAFRLTDKNWMKQYRFMGLPLRGVMLPRSTYTLVLTTRKLNKPPQEHYLGLILQTSALEYQYIYPVKSNKSEYDNFFSEIEEEGKALHEVTIGAVYGDQQGKATSEILSVKDLCREWLTSLDVYQTDQWIVIGDGSRHVRILDNDTQGLVAFTEDEMEETATYVRFIARKKWIVAGSVDGSIYVYSYENNKMQKIEKINAATDRITSLAVHPTLPLLLSTACGSPIKLWSWDKQWECTKEFNDEHYFVVCQVVFNPMDTNSFASASLDYTVKVWNLDLPTSVCTLKEHSGYVNCLDYFTCDRKQYLITGSSDYTAKIWDLEKKVCVHTLDAFAGDVTSVRSHPSLPLLITGSRDGFIHFWSSTTFRLVKVLYFAFGTVVDVGCFKDSRRIVIGQRDGLSVIELDDEKHVASEDQE